ncbi:MAG: glutathione S-transferase family protein [Rhodospirillales bacterium]|nr:MAG: glutathione S-transferase family protein [Rhodospirillales bacterium]
MIDLYTWSTPNGYKVSIMLEEIGLPYRVIPVDIGKGQQFEPAFLALNPNNRIPVIVDTDGPDGRPLPLFESGAILMYLAEKTGQLLPADRVGRYQVVQWLMFQMGGLGPMLGQAHHFRTYAPETIPYAVERYTNEATRLYRVLDHRLGEAAYLGGEYSIADIACYPWIRPWRRQGQDLDAHPNLKRWFEAIDARPAVQRGLKVPPPGAELNRDMDEATRATLFGARQYQARSPE